MLRFASLSFVPHVLTTRAGGVSRGPFASLNLAFHVGDEAEGVRANRVRLGEMAGYDATKLVAMHQVHGDRVRVVRAGDAGAGAFDGVGALAECDALATNVGGVPLLVMVADCAPILLADETSGAFAVVHAGWRGALAGAPGAAVRALCEGFGVHCATLRAGVGPCLSVEALEVGEEVAALAFAVCPCSVVRRADWPRPHLDLRALVRHDLERAGVAPERVEIRPECPAGEADRFFSHRGQNGRAGRFGLVAWRE